MIRRYLRFFRKTSLPAPNTPFGFKLFGPSTMQEGKFEPIETAIADRILDRSDVFINIGANVGYYCCCALAKGKSVFAFEPVDLNVRYLLANIQQNAWADKIEVYPVALGAHPGILEIFGSGTGASLLKGWAGKASTDGALVSVLTLDDVLAARFPGASCFIMIDVEGAEYNVLMGAVQFLAGIPEKPVWMVEICVEEHQPDSGSINPNLERTFRLFFENGYEAWTATEAPRKIEISEVCEVARSGQNSFATHNFIFADSELEVSQLFGNHNNWGL